MRSEIEENDSNEVKENQPNHINLQNNKEMVTIKKNEKDPAIQELSLEPTPESRDFSYLLSDEEKEADEKI